MPLGSHQSLIFAFTNFLIYSFPLWAAFVAFARYYVLSDLRRLGLFFIPWVVTLIVFVIDPGHFIAWFFGQVLTRTFL